MLIVNVNGNIEKGLKELKSKIIKSQQTKKLNKKKTYTKKSVNKRRIVLSAIHRNKKYKND
jgi:ribosomal protein S21